MTVDQVAAAHERYRRDGFRVCPEPVLPGHVVEQAVAGMDALRAGEYDTGRPPHGGGPNLSSRPRRAFAVHLRTERSRPRAGARDGVTEFIDDPAYCPVIFGDAGSLMR